MLSADLLGIFFLPFDDLNENHLSCVARSHLHICLEKPLRSFTLISLVTGLDALSFAVNHTNHVL